MTLHWTKAATDGAARAGTLHTAHGEVPTPSHARRHRRHGEGDDRGFGAVHRRGAWCSATRYHLMLRPGAERVARLGGLHRMMDWHGRF